MFNRVMRWQLNHARENALWAKFSTTAPQRQGRSVADKAFPVRQDLNSPSDIRLPHEGVPWNGRHDQGTTWLLGPYRQASVVMPPCVVSTMGSPFS